MTADRVRVAEVWRLTWSDVDPAGRPAFDPAGVAGLVRALPPAAEVPPPGTDWRLADFWYDRMTEALAERLGDWVAGWWYTVAMEDLPGHGVVPVWRAERPAVTTPEQTLTGIADAVVTWHELLVELATDARARFAAAAPADPDGSGGPPAWRVVQGHGRVAVHASHPPSPLPYPRWLSWADVDPANRTCDPSSVPAVVAGLVGPSELLSPDADWRLRELWLEGVTTGLVRQYGRWAVGWRWAIGEGDFDGGPIGAWCCYAHSVTTPEATAAAISAALLEWHDWLGDVAERFGRFLPLPEDDLDGWERAVAHLVTAVGDRTRYESGWYGCVRTVLGWFLDAAGIDADRRPGLLEHATAGRFRSWVEPPRPVVAAVAQDLARRVAGDHA